MVRTSLKYKDGVTPKLLTLSQNVKTAMQVGVIESVSVSTKAMKQRVKSAVTRTGKLRASGGEPQYPPRAAWFAGRGPGRIESGRMLNSIRWQMDTGAHGVRATAGFINAPPYTALQELGSTGRHPVPPMLAYAQGHTVFAARFDPAMTRYLGSAVRSASRGALLSKRGL